MTEFVLMEGARDFGNLGDNPGHPTAVAEELRLILGHPGQIPGAIERCSDQGAAHGAAQDMLLAEGHDLCCWQADLVKPELVASFLANPRETKPAAYAAGLVVLLDIVTLVFYLQAEDEALFVFRNRLSGERENFLE